MPGNTSRGVVWDLDGVIIDSGDDHWRAWRQLAEETGVAFTEADFRATFGLRNADIIPRFWYTHAPADVQELADRKEELYRDFLRVTARPLPGALELLGALHDAGWKQALGSSAPLANISLIIELLHLERFLDAAVSGEEAPQGKPAPDIFLAAARAINLAPVNCVVIEDAVAGVQAAHAAGMRCIAVTNGRPNPALANADLVVFTLADVSVAQVADLIG